MLCNVEMFNCYVSTWIKIHQLLGSLNSFKLGCRFLEVKKKKVHFPHTESAIIVNSDCRRTTSSQTVRTTVHAPVEAVRQSDFNFILQNSV